MASSKLKLGFALLLLSQASADSAPSYFNSPDVASDSKGAAVLELRAPSSTHGSLSHEALVERAQARAVRRAVAGQHSSSSTQNEVDKLQALGFLGDAYNVPLNMSSKPQLVFVQLDTGSADLFVSSTSCSTPACQSKDLQRFDERASDTYHPLRVSSSSDSPAVNTTSAKTNALPQANSTSSKRSVSRSDLLRVQLAAVGDGTSDVPFSIQYDDTTQATGILGVENVTLANIGVSQQIFGLVSDTNVTLLRQGIAGVLGLGFPRGSAIARSLVNYTQAIDGRSTPLVTSLISSSNVSYPLFSLQLNRTGGRLTVGAVDSDVLPSEATRKQVAWYNVVPFPSGDRSKPETAIANVEASILGQYVYWALRLTQAGVNGSPVNLESTYSQVGEAPLALIDSGTPGIIGPPAAVDAIFDKIFGARHVGNGRYVVPCDTNVRMHFSFGSERNLTLLPSDFIIGPAAGNPYLCFAWPAAVQGAADGIDWVLGQAFMRAQYSIFSLGIAGVEPPKIGFYSFRASANATYAEQYAPEPSASVAAFVSNSASLIATTLPISFVPLPSPLSTAPYIFENATTTPTPGLVPATGIAVGLGAASATYSARLASVTGNEVPVIANASAQVIPVPDNPAAKDAVADAASGKMAIGFASLMALALALGVALVA